MANPKFLYTDLSVPTFTASAGTDASYPLANLQTYVAADQWKAGATTQNQTLALDFGAAKSCNFIILDGHNFNALGCTSIALEAADDSGFSVNLVTPIADLAIVSTALEYETFNAVSKRYWRLKFNKGSALSAAPMLGNLFLDTSLDLSFPYDNEAETGNKGYQTTKKVSLAGTIRTAQSVGGRIIYNIKFSLTSDAFKTSFNTFHDTVKGSLRPFYFLDTDGSTIRYLHFVDDYNPVKDKRYGITDLVPLKMQSQLTS